MHDVSYDWLKLLEKALAKVEQLPVLEEHFPFPWDKAGSALQETLGLSTLSLSCLRAVWKGHHEFLQGMGDDPTIVPFEMAPIEGPFFFVLSAGDVMDLTTEVLNSGEEKENFTGPKLRQGFYRFILLKILNTLNHLNIFKDTSSHLLPFMPFPQETGFCVDVVCTLASRSVQGRLICPHSFLSAFKTHQPLHKMTLLSLSESSPLDVTLRCEIGHTTLSAEEWEHLQVGDFLMLDRCSFNPIEGKGSLTASLGETPLFMARFKPEGMKFLDYAFYSEEDTTPPGTTNLLLKAEIGHLKLALHSLLHLKAGTFLELPMRPEQGINITLSGKRVATAELLKLGDSTGLRLLDIER